MRGRSQESDSLPSSASSLPSPSGTFVDSCDFFPVPLGSDAALWASLFSSARCLTPAPVQHPASMTQMETEVSVGEAT